MSELLKKCIKCDADIPKDAHFCPYCMTKQTEEQFVLIQKRSRKKKTVLILVIALFVCILATAAIIAKKIYDREYVTTEKYGKYIGYWLDDNLNPAKHPNKYCDIRITKVKGNTIYMSFGKSTERKFNNGEYRHYYLENQVVRLKDGVGNFKWNVKSCYGMTKGTHESGEGTVILKKGKIFAELKGNGDTSKDNYNIDMSVGFNQSERHKQGQKMGLEFLTGNYFIAKQWYPTLEKKEQKNDVYIYTFANGGIVAKSYPKDEEMITDVEIDYRKAKSLFSYSFRGMNQNTTEKQFKKFYTDTNHDVELWFEDEDGWLKADDTEYTYLKVFAHFGKDHKIDRIRVHDYITSKEWN